MYSNYMYYSDARDTKSLTCRDNSKLYNLVLLYKNMYNYYYINV